MESNNDIVQSDLLIKLNRLEDEVATLSLQLELNKETIAFLKSTLSERDAYISDLEMKLASVQKELEKTTLDRINELRIRFKTGIEKKFIGPMLTEIRRDIDVLRGLVDQTREVIKQKQKLLQENTQAAIHLVQRFPDQAMHFMEQSIIAPTRFALHHVKEQSAISYAAVVQRLEEELLKPGMLKYERLAYLAKELPSDISVLFQMRVVDPLRAFMNDIPRVTDDLTGASKAHLNQVINYNRKLIKQFIEFLSEEIRKSPFWDGKNRMASA